MTNIFEETLEAVRNGHRFKVDLEGRNLKVNNKFIIDNGEFEGEFGIDIPDNPVAEIELLFHKYQHSRPSERNDARTRRYFRALPEEELSTIDMLYGISREEAQVGLELYILGAILQNKLDWEAMGGGSWFWQSNNEPSLIILRSWCE